MISNPVKFSSWAVPSYHVARSTTCWLHVISARCVTHDLHTNTPWPLERTCWRQFAAQWGDCKKSRIAPLNAIIIIMFFVCQGSLFSASVCLVHGRSRKGCIRIFKGGSQNAFKLKWVGPGTEWISAYVRPFSCPFGCHCAFLCQSGMLHICPSCFLLKLKLLKVNVNCAGNVRVKNNPKYSDTVKTL